MRASLSAAAFVMLAAPTALATPDECQRPFRFQSDPWSYIDESCGFAMEVDGQFTGAQHGAKCDASGNVVDYVFHAVETDTYTRLDDGRQVTQYFNISAQGRVVASTTETVTLEDGSTVTYLYETAHVPNSGVNAVVVAPGDGVIFADVGRLDATVTNKFRLEGDGTRTWLEEVSSDASFAGRWDRFETGGYAFDAICAYLGAP